MYSQSVCVSRNAVEFFVIQSHQLLVPERPEVHVFDPTDVEAFIDEDAGLERLPVEPADEMPAGGLRAEVDALIGVDQQHVADRAVVAGRAADAPGIRDDVGRFARDRRSRPPFSVLLDFSVMKGFAIGFVLAGGSEEDRALGVFAAEGGRRGGEGAFERDRFGDLEIAGDEIFAGRDANPQSRLFAGGIEQRFLNAAVSSDLASPAALKSRTFNVPGSAANAGRTISATRVASRGIRMNAIPGAGRGKLLWIEY